MSPSSPQLDQADRELLVAYLDGELSAEDSAVVESRLASDELFRRELQDLQRTWDALSELPRPVAAEDFTRTTLEMVAVAAQEEVETATTALPRRRQRYLAAILGLVIAGTLSGVLLARVAWPDRNEELLANLPIIEHFEVYRHIGDMEFLRRLDAEFGERLERIASLAPEEVSETWREWQTISQEDRARRRERIASLEPAAAGQLYTKWTRFEKATSDGRERERLRVLHRELLQGAQSQELFATAMRFGDLLSRRSSGDRAELRGKSSTEERIEVIDDWIDDEERDSRLALSFEDRRKLLEFQQAMIARRSERRDDGGRPTPEQREAFRRELDELIESLSPEAQKRLENGRGEREYWVLLRWLRDSTPSWQQMREDLEDFFVSIEDNDEKLRLLLLPDREMHRELRDRYLGPFDEEWRGERGRRGGPGRPDGRGRPGPPERRRGGPGERGPDGPPRPGPRSE